MTASLNTPPLMKAMIHSQRPANGVRPAVNPVRVEGGSVGEFVQKSAAVASRQKRDVGHILTVSCHRPTDVHIQWLHSLLSSSSVVCSSALPHLQILVFLTESRSGSFYPSLIREQTGKTPQHWTTGTFPLKGGFPSNLATHYLHRLSAGKLQTVARTQRVGGFGTLSLSRATGGGGAATLLDPHYVLCF